MRSFFARFTAAALALSFAVPAAAAADPGADSDTDALADPPARVGRLSHTEGTVSFHTKDQDDWAPATLNFPVTSGDSFWTEADSRAEIQVGEVALRMDETTEITAARIDDDATEFEIHQGTVNVGIALPPESPVEIKLPLGAVKLLEAGRYRINAGTPYYGAPPEAMQLTVFAGEARFDSPDGTRVVETGEAVSIGGDPLVFTGAEAVASEFDEWAQARDPAPLPAAARAPVSDSPAIEWNGARVTPSPRSSRTLDYVSPRMTGYQDLDTYGSWSVTGDYGPVWYPDSVPHGWAPYRYGHWAYVPPWGWTWIDDAPWGFAPFHYGRWVSVGSRWGWCPGAYVPRPVYAPALVAFIGGSNWSIGISIGRGPAIGWVPLSPFDHYRPYFKASPHYVKKVNVTNITINKTVINKNVTVINEGGGSFVNRRGATVISSDAFTRGARVHRARLDVGERDIERARLRERLDDVRPGPRARLGIASDRPRRGVPVTARGGRSRGDALETAVPRAPGPDLRNRGRRGESPRPRSAERREVGPETGTPRVERDADDDRRAPDRLSRARPGGGDTAARNPRRAAGRSVRDTGDEGTRTERGRAGPPSPAERGAQRNDDGDRTPDVAERRQRIERRGPPAARPLTAERPDVERRGARGNDGVRARGPSRETGPSQVRPQTAERTPDRVRNGERPRAGNPLTAQRRAPETRPTPAARAADGPNVRARPDAEGGERAAPVVRDVPKRPEAAAPQRSQVRAAPRRAAPPDRDARNAEPARRDAPAVRSVRPDREARQATRRVERPTVNRGETREAPRRVERPVRNLRERSAGIEQRQLRPEGRAPARAERPAPQMRREAPQRMEARETPQAAPRQTRQRVEERTPQRVERPAPERQVQRPSRREAQQGRRNARGGRFGR